MPQGLLSERQDRDAERDTSSVAVVPMHGLGDPSSYDKEEPGNCPIAVVCAVPRRAITDIAKSKIAAARNILVHGLEIHRLHAVVLL